MKLSNESMLLYGVTDRTWLTGRELYEVVEEALKGGITFLQLREKSLDKDAFLKEALVLKALAKEYHVPFVINDDVDIAMDSDADGVHVGQEDGDVVALRQRLGQDKILGVSVQTKEQAIKAEKEGADYLGVGAIFATDTKNDAILVTKEECQAIAEAVSIPICLIGGLNERTIPELKGWGGHGAAVVSAIFAQKDCCQATKELLQLCREVF